MDLRPKKLACTASKLKTGAGFKLYFATQMVTLVLCQNVGKDQTRPSLENGNNLTEVKGGFDLDISEGIAVEMFGISPAIDEVIGINVGECNFTIKGVSKEYQHTCKSTGLMLWESARLISEVLARNPSIVTGKRVLELGCGCTGVASLVAA